MKIPQLLLRQLYTFGSLTNDPNGFRFPEEEHRHIHEDMNIENSTDPKRNTL